MIRRRLGDLEPVRDIAMHGETVRRLLDVEVAHRVRTRRVVEQQIHEVVTVEVGHPYRRVIDGPVWLGHGVVQKIGEFTEDGPHRPFTLAGELDVLATRHLVDLPWRLAIELGLERPLLQFQLSGGQGVRQVVAAPDGVGSSRCWSRFVWLEAGGTAHTTASVSTVHSLLEMVTTASCGR
jgi:hypothetical protein